MINAIVHADYSVQGSSIQISIYANRMEVINPGALPFGQTMDAALSGVSKMRNPIIGRIFREIGIIESLGIGMTKIREQYLNIPTAPPVFGNLDHYFKVVLHARPIVKPKEEAWVNEIYEVLAKRQSISTHEMALIWQVTDRTARNRLNSLIRAGILRRNAKSKNDPQTTYCMI